MVKGHVAVCGLHGYIPTSFIYFNVVFVFICFLFIYSICHIYIAGLKLANRFFYFFGKLDPEPCLWLHWIFYRELLEITCRVANVLKKDAVKKGNRVAIYACLSSTGGLHARLCMHRSYILVCVCVCVHMSHTVVTTIYSEYINGWPL